MNAIRKIEDAFLGAGYRREAVVRDYAFADVLSPTGVTRKVPIAAFTQTPPSYRSAAFGVIEESGDAMQLVQSHQALGAPLLFVIAGKQATLWQVRSATPPRMLERLPVASIPALFKEMREVWRPQSIHRAKSIGAFEGSYQLDFVDVGLLPAIEGQIHTKLDRLLVEGLAAAHDAAGSRRPEPHLLFRVVFRLLAAKVLLDRKHSIASSWNANDLPELLQGIERYYSLKPVPLTEKKIEGRAFSAIWSTLRQGISFANISSDDLAFVYENTLVTPEVRKHFGTHSTPRQVAEYVVERLKLHTYDPKDLRLYEPFVGAGTFLVSALRHLRDALPVGLTDQQRHDFLVERISGDEIDPFACEVATLSLILADYPNHNGWHITEKDLFANATLDKRMRAHNVVLCNPPFEAFNPQERRQYPSIKAPYSKPIMVLASALDAHPLALGFVLPRGFILDQQFAEQRRRIEKLYGAVEIVELPDRIFGASTVEASLLIATQPHSTVRSSISLTSTEVADRDRVEFLKTGEITTQRRLVRPVGEPSSGQLWIRPLTSLWAYLSEYPLLSTQLRPSWGLQWRYNQTDAFSERQRPGYRKGFHSARHLRQFTPNHPVWLDYRRDHVRRGYGQPWDQPKLIVNEGRLSRGPWRIAAFLDTEGHAYSQQFFGLWPTSESLTLSELNILCAILNGPVANAYVAIHSPAKGIRARAIAHIPIPHVLPSRVSHLVAEYLALTSSHEALQSNSDRLVALLAQIDAAVLEAYDLPPRLEQELFDYFRDASRPVNHPWPHWDDAFAIPGLRLAERLAANYPLREGWIAKVFKQLPETEAALLREYGE